ncbi:gibberellin 2-beta-dioxygenase 6-like [Hordeum vulgare subsp. vulgare]|uniref:gibberellin 2beta-dioxygenase n=1 Tax=Hordeum vulgare subsp. vulgare TaxID=112509 RepID=A0A8I6WW53_HORVV|nr:gibberellin 2-beta-dioxygenase 6-like [Hordeum vulgare subsp. vulgare]
MPAFAEPAIDPPLADSYRALLRSDERAGIAAAPATGSVAVLERDLPMIDLERLRSGDARERKACADAMAAAASEWGFFQVINHGVGRQLLEEMRREQARLFRLPFDTKEKAGLLNGSYRWGNPTATSLRHLSWSEAFHVPLATISREDCDYGKLSSLREVMQEVADAMSCVADTVAGALAEELGHAAGGGESTFPAGCDGTTCFLRLNRYPACPFAPDTFGLVPHTDSDFLTILCQDQVGGLQLMKDARWVAVKPHPDALIVNVGDLFQAWSNNRYKSVEHKVVANYKAERFSVAYFLCPSYDSPVGTCSEPSPYRPFTFGEYRRKVQDDVKRTGKKIGLPNFLKHSPVHGLSS